MSYAVQPPLRLVALIGMLLASSQLLAGAAPRVFGSGFEAEPATAKWVAGYYVGYERELQPVPQLDFDGLSHLMVGAVLPNADGTLTTHYYIDTFNDPLWAQAAIDAAQAAGRKALLMIGGAGTIDGWRGAASNANRAAFVARLLALVEQTGADGLDRGGLKPARPAFSAAVAVPPWPVADGFCVCCCGPGPAPMSDCAAVPHDPHVSPAQERPCHCTARTAPTPVPAPLAAGCSRR